MILPFSFRKLLGPTLSGLLMVLTACGSKPRPEPTHTCSSTQTFYDKATPLFSFSEDQSWEDTINTCIFAKDNQYCGLQTLPLIGSGKQTITQQEVLTKTFATHKWMKERFATLLSGYPDELVQMFRHVTSVIISSEARPSHYWTAHGAIVLDPAYLWLSQEERQTIFELEDCRAANFRKDDLSFRVYDVNFLNGQLLSSLDRSLTTISINLGSLLAHELAHAMDFTGGIKGEELPDQPVFELITPDNILSERLNLTEGANLDSPLLNLAASFFYQGVDASPELVETTATDIGKAFESSGAINLYAYTNIREDFAMLIEAHFGRKYWQIESSLAVVELAEQAQSCKDYTLYWGQRNRDLFDPVAERINLAVALGEPTLALSDNRGEHPDPMIQPHTENRDFCSFLTL